MATQIKQYNNFNGGIAEGSKLGYPNSFQNGIGIDYKTDPDRVTSLYRLKLDYSPTDLIKDSKEYKGKKFFYGDAGNIYQKDTNGTWTSLRTVPNSTGQGFDIFADSLWYANLNSIGKATGLTGTPTFIDNYITTAQFEGYSFTYQGATNLYTLPVAISETSTNKYPFTASTNLINGILINPNTAGTGNWTITIHDNSNNVIYAETITNANVKTNYSRYIFATPVQVTAGSSYHFHLTSTVADGKIIVNTTGDLSTGIITILKILSNNDIDQFNTVGTGNAGFNQIPNSYSTPTSINESAPTARCSFIPNVPIISGISILFLFGGTNATLTLHDSNNNVLGTASITGANIGDGSWAQFIFSSAIILQAGATYHFHITSASTAQIVTSSNGDLSVAYYKTHYGALLDDANFHSAKVFGNKICFGNGRYLATLDDSEIFNPAAVAFPKDESVRCIETIGDYLAISTWKGANIASYGYGRIYFWDGVSPFYSLFIDIDGQVNAIKNDGNNNLIVLHGTQGNLSVYVGSITKLKRIKYIKPTMQTIFNPKAIDTWEGQLLFGNGNSSSSAFDTLVYSYGRKDKDYSLTLNKDYIISTGNKNSNVTIGNILGISATELYICWKDTTGPAFGIDIIDVTQQQLSTFLYTLREDNGDSHRQKTAKTASLRFDPIATNQKIRVAYRINNANKNTDISGFTVLGSIDPVNNSNDFVGQVLKTFPLPNNGIRYLEIEWLVELDTQAGTIAPTLISLGYEFEESSGEFQINYI